jgi:hypothetical protein
MRGDCREHGAEGIEQRAKSLKVNKPKSLKAKSEIASLVLAMTHLPTAVKAGSRKQRARSRVKVKGERFDPLPMTQNL